MPAEILINVRPLETRVAYVEAGTLMDLKIERKTSPTLPDANNGAPTPAVKPRGGGDELPHGRPCRPGPTPSTNAPPATPDTSANNAAPTATHGVNASAQAAPAPTATTSSLSAT